MILRMAKEKVRVAQKASNTAFTGADNYNSQHQHERINQND